MAFVKGRGVRVEVAQTMGTPVSVTGVTQASPGVATSTAHGLADGAVGVFSAVGGMVQLEGQAARVDAPTTNTFDLQGVNTTNFSAFSGTASFTPVSAWLTLAESDQYDIGGGEAEVIDVTTLIDVIKQEEAGNLPAQSVTINIKSTDAPSAAMAVVEAAAQAGTQLAFRITLQGGAVRIFSGEPSLPGESVSAGQVGTGSFGVKVKGRALKLAA